MVKGKHSIPKLPASFFENQFIKCKIKCIQSTKQPMSKVAYGMSRTLSTGEVYKLFLTASNFKEKFFLKIKIKKGYLL